MTRLRPGLVALATGLAVLLPACGGSGSEGTGGAPAVPAASPVSGQQVYLDRCAMCHGRHGEGGAGSRLADGRVVARFPRVGDEEAVVNNGAASGAMPAFGTVLSAAELHAVVAYTRHL